MLDLAEASEADWERYETGWRDGITSFVREHPTDPDAEKLAETANQGWKRFDELGGRETLGFALPLARKTERPSGA